MDLFSCLSSLVFCSLASGSSGNCYFVGTAEEGILVDVGIPTSQIKKRLQKIGYSLSQIKAVFVTHDHIDHIKGIESLVNQNGIPVFAHRDCLDGILANKASSKIDPKYLNELSPFVTCEVAGIDVVPFPVMHDGRGMQGYYLSHDEKSLTIATDVGVLDDVVSDFLCKSDSIVIESNYDEEMLRTGGYPYPLKQRITSKYGHLSNTEASNFIVKHYRPEMKNIMLCHLSENNNKPELAIRCLFHLLRVRHVKLSNNMAIFTLPRHQQTDLIYL